ncbi:patatin-like protein [Umezawaea beigongshangensis]|uniref:patatin-like protein n=1 Tax=Umezawaea beigongshangensis TaxID=2780383 RepID=UPI0018F1A47D|nr:patatin-like protein [Umezawaea beigongshangensis]
MTEDAASAVPVEEIRFAVVLNGGVSLAVWMGGVVLELDRLTRAGSDYERLLAMVGCSARADVITGTSAGGINGAALALSQVNRRADLSRLRDLWAEQGRMEQLLRTPFQGQPVSLLKGDEFFLPRLQEALERLTTDFEPTLPHERPIDLRITTTLLSGVSETTHDDLGQALVQSAHQGSFSFRRDAYDWSAPPNADTRDDFRPETLPLRVRQLALAARSSASFPFAFEPSFVPVNGPAVADRPDMGDVASWAAEDGSDRSRFAVDGGVLVNTPTREALEAVDRMPADGPVRRVMLLVFPHAQRDGAHDPAHRHDDMPSTLGAGGDLLGALTSQSSRTYVERVEEHNRVAAARRSDRNALLERLALKAGTGHERPITVTRELYTLAHTLHDHYEDVRIRQAARDLTMRQFDSERARPQGASTAVWSFERVRAAAEAAQRAWLKDHGVLPYVPASPPPTAFGEGWPWGVLMAERLASAVLDVLKRLVWVVPDGGGGPEGRIAVLRTELHRARAELKRLRENLEHLWTAVEPGAMDQAYWTRRLAAYAENVIGPGDNTTGRQVRQQVDEVARVLAEARTILVGLTDDERLKLGGLHCWKVLLKEDRVDGETGTDGEVWLSRVLALEIAATCLADDSHDGSDQPVELVQVSLQTRNAFAVHSLTADDKAGGAALSRFSGFLKRSWRVNDWIWGRLDGATMLCRVLFDPRRLRRVDLMAGTGGTARERACAQVAALVDALFGGVVPEIADLVAAAEDELTSVHEREPGATDLPPSLRALSDLAAWGLHLRIAVEELPRLRQAILADRVDGADPRSRGELFLQEHERLLHRLESPPDFAREGRAAAALGMDALRAFDRAGIGREPLGQEAGSDQLIRTAATAAAVAVTVADSSRSGLAPLKPITRGVRGATLLPYWVITGLTRGGKLAQFLGLGGLAAGGALLVAAVFGLLPNWATAPAASLGSAALLAAFGYAALRSGTLLHGLVLLAPVIPLAVLAFDRVRTAAGDSSTSDQVITGAVTVGGVLSVVAALLVIGSLPSPVRTPLAVLADLRLRRRLFARLRRRSTWVAVVVLAVLAGAVWAVLALRLHDVRWLRDGLAILVTVGSVLFGWRAALRGGLSLQRWRRDEDGWTTERAEPPEAATAGWAVVYGVVFLVIGAVLVIVRPEQAWALTAMGTALVFGLVLLLVTTWLVPRRGRSRISDALVEQAISPVYPDLAQVEVVLRQRLEGHAMLYRYLVRPVGDDRTRPQDLELSRAGRVVAKRIREKLTAGG